MLWLLLLQVWASCLWLGNSEVGTSFDSCPQFFYRETPPNNALEPENPAWICQRYTNQYFYATLYDRDMHTPVYSAYIYHSESENRPRAQWMVEPQLIGPTFPSNMKTEENLIEEDRTSQEEIKESQAVNKDYNNLDGFDRGHLNPSGHQNDEDSMIATFTLTNIVPQNSALNQGSWSEYEQKTMYERSRNCKTTYVIAGAVPGKKYIANGRVNIPSHIWSAACCKMKNKMTAWAAIAENDEDQVEILTLGQLETMLSRLYKRGQVSLFHSDCPRK